MPVAALLLLAALLSFAGNRPVFLFFNQFAAQAGGAGFWAHWTMLGDALLLLVFALPFAGRRPDVVWAVWIVAVLTTVVVHVLKAGVGAPRPPAVFDPAQIYVVGHVLRSGSFPSGHTAAAFAFAGVLALCLRRAWVTAGVLCLAAGVGISRMAVGVHWPVDVLSGAALGWLGACAAVVLARRWAWGLALWAQRGMAALFVVAALVMLWGYDAGFSQTSLMQRLLAAAALLAATPGLIRLARGRASLPDA